MAGIYVHIPYCRKACHYCNFHFSTSLQTRSDMLLCLIRELNLRVDYLAGQPVETIYFGGGTPSALPAEDIHLLMQTIAELYAIEADAEITLEANPDDITPENLQQWKSAGINRLSIGIQAFQDELLLAWNRSHNAAEAMTAIHMAQAAGIDNITADLIYGGPGLSDEDWISNIMMLLSSGIPHISSYALTVEPRTALHYQIAKRQVAEPDEDQANRQYAILQSLLRDAGFEQYEVSNFAKPGFASRHNTSYWRGVSYLGIGPSAHSYNQVSRQWNIAHNVKYIEALREDRIPAETELLTLTQQYNEWVMTGLRTAAGIDLKRIEAIGKSYLHYLDEQVQPYLEKGIIIREGLHALRLDDAQFFFADGIASDLFYLDS